MNILVCSSRVAMETHFFQNFQQNMPWFKITCRFFIFFRRDEEKQNFSNACRMLHQWAFKKISPDTCICLTMDMNGYYGNHVTDYVKWMESNFPDNGLMLSEFQSDFSSNDWHSVDRITTIIKIGGCHGNRGFSKNNKIYFR